MSVKSSPRREKIKSVLEKNNRNFIINNGSVLKNEKQLPELESVKC